MKLVLTGRNRFVILVAGVAIKVPSTRTWRDFLFGILNNLNEAAWSGEAAMAHCPVVWRSPLGLILVQRRARILTDQEFIDLHPQLPPARAEPKADSWGWLDGRLVAVDYGW